MDYVLQSISSPFRGGYWAYNRQYIGKPPIRRIETAADRGLRDAIVKAVERMLGLQERLKPPRGTSPAEERELLHEVEQVDGEIDGLVYELYGLTQVERKLVEGGLA